LFTSDFQVKIVDFGLSKLMEGDEEKELSTPPQLKWGKIEYLPPELFF